MRTVLLLTRGGGRLRRCHDRGKQSQHLVLALGELRERRGCSCTAEVTKHLSRDSRAEERLAATYRAHRRNNLLRRRSLECVAVGAGAERGEYVLVVVVHGENERARRQPCRPQLSADPQPIAVGHVEVEHGDIGLVFGRGAGASRPVVATAITLMSSSASKTARSPLTNTG